MKRPSIYFVFGLLLIGTIAAAEWRGWTVRNPTEVRNVPRTVRDNPGSYRPHYTYIGSGFRRGK